MDALLLEDYLQITYSITRSDVFKKQFQWFLDALKMIPIYRIRDGYGQLAKNEETFRTINSSLFRGHAVTIFSEGNHGNDFFLRDLSKGSSRMALEAQEKMDHLDIKVIPVGLNYFHHQRPFHKIYVWCISEVPPIILNKSRGYQSNGKSLIRNA